MPEAAAPRWMTRQELAHDLRVSEDTIRALEAQGKLPKANYLTPRLPRYDRHAVDEALGLASKKDASSEWDGAFRATTPNSKNQKAPRRRIR